MTIENHTGTVVHQVLSDLEFPACRWQLIAEAVTYGADNVTLAKLHRLPPRRYVSCEEVAAAIDASCRPRQPRRAMVIPMNVPHRSLVTSVVVG